MNVAGQQVLGSTCQYSSAIRSIKKNLHPTPSSFYPQAYSPHGSHQVGLRALSLSSFQLSTIPNALDTTLADHVTFKSSGPGLRPTPYSSISQRVVLPAIHGSWVRRADGSFGPDDDAVEHWNTGRMQGGSLPLSPSLQRLWQPPETGRMNGGGVKLPGLHTPAESRSHLGPGSPLLVSNPSKFVPDVI